MPKKKAAPDKIATTPQEKEMAAIRKVPRAERSEEQIARLQQLVAEERRDRFCRNAKAKVDKAVKALGGVAQLANPNSYSYSPEDREYVLSKLGAAMERLTAAFTPENGEGDADDVPPWMETRPADPDADDAHWTR